MYLVDAHIMNHFDAVKEQLQRTSKKFPKLKIRRPIKVIDEFTMEDFEVIGYDPDPFIKASMSSLAILPLCLPPSNGS